jgi:hypothetical protein
MENILSVNQLKKNKREEMGFIYKQKKATEDECI